MDVASTDLLGRIGALSSRTGYRCTAGQGAHVLARSDPGADLGSNEYEAEFLLRDQDLPGGAPLNGNDPGRDSQAFGADKADKGLRPSDGAHVGKLPRQDRNGRALTVPRHEKPGVCRERRVGQEQAKRQRDRCKCSDVSHA